MTASSKKRRLSIIALGGLAMSLAGCAATTVLNTLEPRFCVSTTRDIAYAAGARHDLDVYAPAHPGAHAPVVVFIYGGGWDSGEKSQYAFVGDALATHGYVAVIPNYRIYPEARYPDFLEDSAKATAWAKAHARDFGGDPDKLFLMGHSAGAYNAMMLALDARWLAAVGLDPQRDVKGAVGLAGPYDFLPLKSAELKTIFGAEGQTPASQPINHVTADEPPLFLAHDEGDQVVYPSNTEHLAAKARAAGAEVEARYYKGLSHALMIGVFAAPLRFLAPVFHDATDFIDRHAAAPQNKGASSIL